MEQQENIRSNLNSFLQTAIRDLQKEYVVYREIISSCELTNCLCYALEAVFLHGLFYAVPDKPPTYNFWTLLSKYTHRSTLRDVDALSQIKTDIGRCRVWIRLVLNGVELESYLRLILADKNTLEQYYKPSSFIRDAECVDLLMTSIQGLESIRFCLGHNSTVLNEWSNAPLSLAGLLTSSPTTSTSDDIQGTNSPFDDYELSPEDREEIRLMFRPGSCHGFISSRKCGRMTIRRWSDMTTQTDVLDSVDADVSNDVCCEETMRRSTSLVIERPFCDGASRHGGRSVVVRTGSVPTTVTDGLRDIRFNRIVKENLEKYPIDYDRLQRQTTATTEQTDSIRSKRGWSFERSSPSEQTQICRLTYDDRSPTCETVPENGESGAPGEGEEEDGVQKTESEWNEGGSSAIEFDISDSESQSSQMLVQSNSLPKDAWISPSIDVFEFSPADISTMNLNDVNDRVKNEFEASYGTILSQYQKTIPKVLKMATPDIIGTIFAESEKKDDPKDRKSKEEKSFQSPFVGTEIEDEWVLVDEKSPFTAEPYHVDTTLEKLLPFITERYTERSLSEQGYKCRGCCEEVSLGVEEKGRRCSFNGYVYCSLCHRNGQFYIPSRIIYAWDFKKYNVSNENLKFLQRIYDWPLINIEELNVGIDQFTDELKRVKDLRRQSYYLTGYMFHCTSQGAAKFWKAMNARLYYFSHIDNYSIKDLVNVSFGSFRKTLQKINDSAIKHIYRCKSCQQRGFYCEVCQDPEIIYPFEIDKTIVCERCKNVYHVQCRADSEMPCPKCTRIRMRETMKMVDPIELVLYTHPEDRTLHT